MLQKYAGVLAEIYLLDVQNEMYSVQYMCKLKINMYN